MEPSAPNLGDPEFEGIQHRSARCRGLGVVGIIVLLAVASALIPPTPAMADSFGGCSVATGEGCHADNSIHTYCYGAGFPATLEDEADHTMDKAIDRDTILSDDFESICNTTIDIKWLAADLGPGVRGDYMCLDPNGLEGQQTCYAARVRLNPDYINQGSNDAEDRKKTACHEAGHSLGLQTS